MKKIIYVLGVVALFFASCSNNENEVIENPTAKHTVRVKATLGETLQTRTSLERNWNETNGYGFKVKWKVGDRISILCWQGDDSHWGDLIGKGEIVYLLTAEDISEDGKSIDFPFFIPSQITDASQPIKVLITYLGDAYYRILPDNHSEGYKGKPWLDIPRSKITDKSKYLDYSYAAGAMPMTLRGEIAAGWDKEASQAVLKGTFQHLTTLFALQVKNNTTAPISPKSLYIYFNNGTVMNGGYPYWNPITPEVPLKQNQLCETYFFSSSYSHTIPAGDSHLFLVPAVILPGDAPTVLYTAQGYKITDDKTVWLRTKAKENTSISLQAGKCYTLNVQVNSLNEDDPNALTWNTDTPIEVTE